MFLSCLKNFYQHVTKTQKWIKYIEETQLKIIGNKNVLKECAYKVLHFYDVDGFISKRGI